MVTRRHLVALFLVSLLASSDVLAAHEIRGPIAPPATVVNAVIGDVSFFHTFGRLPNEGDDEDLRLQTHLRYVEQVLRGRDVSHLSSAQRAARASILDVLHEYHVAGFFPRNRALPGRRPVFVDTVSGAVCAVGYLIEQTRGRDVVEAVNADFQYASIFQIDAPVLDAWLDEHGLTRVEAAMIQPFYSDLVEATVDTPGHIVVVPDGSGPSLGAEGHTVRVRLEDGNGGPIVGYPFQDLVLAGSGADGPLDVCPGGSVADANTDATGETTFTGSLAAGGWSDALLYVYVAGVINTFNPLQITVNSPDLNGDLRVDINDVGLFAQDFASPYVFRADLAGDLDGVLNIADVGAFATSIGRECP